MTPIDRRNSAANLRLRNLAIQRLCAALDESAWSGRFGRIYLTADVADGTIQEGSIEADYAPRERWKTA